MNENDMVEDFTINNKTYEIIERKLNYDPKTKKWTWSKPKTIRYKRLIEDKYFDIIQKLISSDDLQSALNPPKKQESDEKLDSGIGSIASFSDNSKNELIFWDIPKLKIGEIYLVSAKGNKWINAKLIHIDTNGLLHVVDTRSWEPLKVTYKYIAPAEPVDCLLNIGTRVVAFVTKIQSTGEIGGGRRFHSLGVVGEIPTPENRSRYLVILDSGVWTYVTSNEIWPIYYQSKNVWDMVPESAQRTVRDFLTGRYQHPTDYKKGDSVKYTGEDCGVIHGIVIYVDSSILLVFFTNRGTSSWMHSGSPDLVKT